MKFNELVSEICKRTKHVDATEAGEVIRALKDIFGELTAKELVDTLSALTKK